ncbi:MAG: hypothetical protein Q9157_003998 [Trypethelium eluteriae]
MPCSVCVRLPTQCDRPEKKRNRGSNHINKDPFDTRFMPSVSCDASHHKQSFRNVSTTQLVAGYRPSSHRNKEYANSIQTSHHQRCDGANSPKLHQDRFRDVQNLGDGRLAVCYSEDSTQGLYSGDSGYGSERSQDVVDKRLNGCHLEDPVRELYSANSDYGSQEIQGLADESSPTATYSYDRSTLAYPFCTPVENTTSSGNKLHDVTSNRYTVPKANMRAQNLDSTEGQLKSSHVLCSQDCYRQSPLTLSNVSPIQQGNIGSFWEESLLPKHQVDDVAAVEAVQASTPLISGQFHRTEGFDPDEYQAITPMAVLPASDLAHTAVPDDGDGGAFPDFRDSFPRNHTDISNSLYPKLGQPHPGESLSNEKQDVYRLVTRESRINFNFYPKVSVVAQTIETSFFLSLSCMLLAHFRPRHSVLPAERIDSLTLRISLILSVRESSYEYGHMGLSSSLACIGQSRWMML